ncbi:MAG TPA: ATPase, T2SS/T4P/T4SS family, partial [Bdellovibrionota bacterium]|nr:ATPase, T2SS/T4P/T4SS family [Bdellovibrionota bacterium]
MSERSTIYELRPNTTRPGTVPEIVDYLLNQAIKMKASDLHLGLAQVQGAGLGIILRVRVHGKLQLVKSDFLMANYKEIVARLKIMAGINTTEASGPQDGNISLMTPEGLMTLRLNIIPAPEGDEVVGRLQRAQKSPTLAELGMTREMMAKIPQLLQQKSGLIVINGPAGSGKTTTIHACLSALAGPEKKVVTAEDPIELRLPFVSHTAVSAKMSFAALARSFMRQDADVIFIGEIRDADSAEAAIQLAQTGHLVLTTLHTRDAAGVIPRLEAFGIHPAFIAGTLIGSLAQRLVPRICPSCRLPGHVDDQAKKAMMEALPPPPSAQFYKTGPGCASCSGGVAGRMAFYELLAVDSVLSEMINRRASRAELLAAARSRGMFSLVQEALVRVYGGYVDLESVRGYLMTGDSPSAAAA